MELVQFLMQDCKNTSDIQSKLKRLFAGTIEQMLKAEIYEHLGYEKHNNEGDNSGNSRNGYNHKTITSDYGESVIAVPRDRNGEFEPPFLKKRQTQNRPFDAIYPIIYFDGIVFKSCKDSQIVNKCVYSVLGFDMDGQKDIWGICISENDGASFYASIGVPYEGGRPCKVAPTTLTSNS